MNLITRRTAEKRVGMEKHCTTGRDPSQALDICQHGLSGTKIQATFSVIFIACIMLHMPINFKIDSRSQSKIVVLFLMPKICNTTWVSQL